MIKYEVQYSNLENGYTTTKNYSSIEDATKAISKLMFTLIFMSINNYTIKITTTNG